MNSKRSLIRFDRVATAESFSRYWAGALLLLITVSYRLWLPVDWTHSSDYPNVPLWALSERVVWWISACLLPVIGIATGIVLIGGRVSWIGAGWQRVGWLAVAVMLAVGFVGDQHRLQPWAYQSFLYASWFVLLPARWRMTAFRVLTISIYFYSSIGKFDYQFLHTVGQDFLTTACRCFGIDIENWSSSSRLNAAAVFPAFELSVACLLAVPRTRLVGGWMAIGMHASLIAMLSPWAMDHSPGVIMWNAVLAGQTYWLFLRDTQDVSGDETLAFRRVRLSVSALLLLLAITLPLSERRDRVSDAAWHWDHWTSWALYSPHNSRTSVEFHASVLDGLSPRMKLAVGEDQDGDRWHEFDLGKFSLQSRGVPVLPQARYQWLLARAIADQKGWTHQIRSVLRSSSDRWDGSRREVWMNQL